MFKKLMLSVAILSGSAIAQEVPITGNVESKCIVQTDTLGVYGNPTPSQLTTASTSGGVVPIIRFDVIQASFYKARITTPNGFSESPALDDVVTWTGDVAVGEVSDATMSSYSTSKVEYDNTTEIDLTVAGSTWFNVTSTADYGYDTALPAGTYRAVVSAECIAL
jgi:hypothetical protein